MFKLLKFKASKQTRIISFLLVGGLIVLTKTFSGAGSAPAPTENAPLSEQLGEIAGHFKQAVALVNDLSNAAEAVKTQVTVARVVDGDTFIDNEGNRYRIAFIDAPESKQAFGTEAANFLNALIEGKNVTIENLYKDKHSRIVAKVYLGGVDIAEILVEFGYAWNQAKIYDAEKNYSDKLETLEASAKENKAGLWALENIESPFEFRKNSFEIKKQAKDLLSDEGKHGGSKINQQ